MRKDIEGDTLWQVVSTRDRERRRMERYLEAGGFQVAHEGMLPLDIRLSTLRAAVGLSESEREVLEAMLMCDGAQEIADYLHISRHTVYDRTKALMRSFKVRSRYRIIVQALRSGVLEITNARKANNHKDSGMEIPES